MPRAGMPAAPTVCIAVYVYFIISLVLTLPPIFAFLTLNTPRSAHKEILSAKFLSFERAAIACWYIADYAVGRRNVQWMTKLNKSHWVAIEPLLHSNTASLAMQYSLFCTLIALLLECKRGCIDKSGCHKRNKTAEKRLAKSLKPIFIL